MKVVKYCLKLILFAIFLQNVETSAASKNLERQLHNTVFTTRAPLINRVRERLTSIIMQSHEHLAYHHQQLHQHHQNHWNVLHGLLYTSPISPVSTSTEISLNSTTTFPVTSTPMLSTSTSTVGTQPSTTFSSTTLSPQKNSQSVTLPFFISTNQLTQSTTFSTTMSTLKSTESTTPKTDSTTTKIDPTTTKIETTTSKTDPTTSKTDPTTSKTDPTTSKTEPTTTKIETTTLKTDPTTSKIETTTSKIETTTSKTIPTTQSLTQTTTISVSTTKAPIKDPCDDRKILYANGVALINLCYINESLTWFEAQQKCLSLKYRLFEINTYYKEISMFNYFKVFAVNNQFHWINGIADYTSTSTEWFVVDPRRVWNYTSNNWYGLVKAPVPGLCLGIIFVSGAGKFTEKDCDVFHSTFWCEY